MTPQQFIAKWQRVSLSERSACQQHFLDLCDLLGQPKPAAADPDGAWYTFERGVSKTSGGKGWADVWMKNHFGWEYKGKHKDLAAAYQQLLQYREDLENPPLLVVCDLDRFEVHTNFTGTVKQVHAFNLAGLANPANLDVLRKVFTEPDTLKPGQTREGITEEASQRFGVLADSLRNRAARIAADGCHSWRALATRQGPRSQCPFFEAFSEEKCVWACVGFCSAVERKVNHWRGLRPVERIGGSRKVT